MPKKIFKKVFPKACFSVLAVLFWIFYGLLLQTETYYLWQKSTYEVSFSGSGTMDC